MSRAISFTQAQVRRAVRAAESVGIRVKKITVNPDGSITVESGDTDSPPLDIRSAMSEWQSIETAPRDGTRVLIADQNTWMAVARNWPCNGFWIEDAASGLRLNDPTHWMPLPTPPSGQGRE